MGESGGNTFTMLLIHIQKWLTVIMTITASTHKYSKFIQHIFKKFYIRMSRKIALHYFIGHKYLACFMKCLNYNFKLYMFQLLTTNSLPSGPECWEYWCYKLWVLVDDCVRAAADCCCAVAAGVAGRVVCQHTWQYLRRLCCYSTTCRVQLLIKHNSSEC